MRTVRTKVYKFGELSEDAKQKAIEKFWDVNVDYEWWEGIYEDAKNIGLKITSFDVDRHEIEGYFELSAAEIAANIFRDHGEICETYKNANDFMKEHDPIFSNYMQTEEGEDKLLQLEDEFRTDLLEDYLSLLKAEYEYRTSEEAIIESIESNEYEFTKDGKQF